MSDGPVCPDCRGWVALWVLTLYAMGLASGAFLLLAGQDLGWWA